MARPNAILRYASPCFLALLLLFVTSSALAQVSDSCASAGALSSNWTNNPGAWGGYGTLVCSAGQFVPSATGTQAIALYTGTTFAADQWVEFDVPVTLNSSNNSGGTIRMSASGGYFWFMENLKTIYKLNASGGGAGAISGLTCPSPISGHHYRMQAVGTTFTCKDVTAGTSASATDSTYATGRPGLLVDQRNGGPDAFANFTAGSSASMSVAPGLILAGTTSNTIAVTGNGTSFSGSPFTLSGGTGAAITSQTITDSTHAIVVITASSSEATLTLTDTGSGSTATIQSHALTTYYVRADGGPRSRCTGKVDAADTGSGTNQPCALGDYRWLYDDQTYGGSNNWLISGGDTVVVRNGPWRIGFSQGVNGSDPWCIGGTGPIGCIPPPPPSGTPAHHTKFFGENYVNCVPDITTSANPAGCTGAKTILRLGYGAYAPFSFGGSSYVDVIGFQTDDSAQCKSTGEIDPLGIVPQCSNTYPYSDFGQTGASFNNSSHDILLAYYDAFAMKNRCLYGATGGNIIETHIHCAYSGQTCIDFDDGTHSSGTWGLYDSLIEFCGWVREYPVVHAQPGILAIDDVHGTVADGVGTPDTPLQATIRRSTFRYSTQDGVDLGHIDGLSGGLATADIQDSVFYGNEGQQVKFGGVSMGKIINNRIISNCHRGQSGPVGDSTDNQRMVGDSCRAAGDGISINVLPAGSLIIDFNTVVGYSNEFMLIGCWGSDTDICKGSSTIEVKGNVWAGQNNPSWNSGIAPNFLAINATATRMDGSNFTFANNLYFNLKNGYCPTGETGSICGTSPLLNSSTTFVSETYYDTFDFTPQAGSPLLGAGPTSTTITADALGATRGSVTDIGALQRTLAVIIRRIFPRRHQ